MVRTNKIPINLWKYKMYIKILLAIYMNTDIA
jgi:hypothetical protein